MLGHFCFHDEMNGKILCVVVERGMSKAFKGK